MVRETEHNGCRQRLRPDARHVYGPDRCLHNAARRICGGNPLSQRIRTGSNPINQFQDAAAIHANVIN